MKTTTKIRITTMITLGMLGALMCFNLTQAAAYLIDPKSTQEYYLPGTLEEKSDFNFNLDPGGSTNGTLTIVNRSPNNNKYNLFAVDSELNNQQNVVFKSVSSENNNLGKWITFESPSVSVPSNSTQAVNFTIKAPYDTYAGTYYGGISLNTVKTEPANNNTAKQDQSFTVSVQTRYVIPLNVNVSGKVIKNYKFGQLQFNPDKKVFTFDIANEGNVLMIYSGTIDVTINSIFREPETVKIPIHEIKLLPGNSVTRQIIFNHQLPLFGNTTSVMNGQLKSFNGVTNQYELITEINQKIDNNFFSWPLLIGIMAVLAILILLMILQLYLSGKYRKECVKYEVQENDTLEKIAEKYGMSWKKLARINKLKAPYNLSPNKTILVHAPKKD